jgi:hypothetical protein
MVVLDGDVGRYRSISFAAAKFWLSTLFHHLWSALNETHSYINIITTELMEYSK